MPFCSVEVKHTNLIRVRPGSTGSLRTTPRKSSSPADSKSISTADPPAAVLREPNLRDIRDDNGCFRWHINVLQIHNNTVREPDSISCFNGNFCPSKPTKSATTALSRSTTTSVSGVSGLETSPIQRSNSEFSSGFAVRVTIVGLLYSRGPTKGSTVPLPSTETVNL